MEENAAAPSATRPKAGNRRGPRRDAASRGLSAEQIAEIAAKAAASAIAASMPSFIDAVTSKIAERGPPPSVGGHHNYGGAPPMAEGLSDEDVLEMFQSQEVGEFDIPPEIIPDGIVYEWKALEVRGQPSQGYLGELQRQRWSIVPADRHEGLFMANNTTGPIMRKGLTLMERPVEIHELRQRYQRLLAKQAVLEKEQQLGAAPPGTGPRQTARLAPPRVSKSYERAPPGMVVQG